MSILITAPIRTGKTLFAMDCIFKELNKGKLVYTNIIGITIPGVIVLTSTPTNPIDWRDLPNGSVLVLDEVHEHPSYSESDLLKTLTLPDFEELLRKVEYIADAKERKEKREYLQSVYKKTLEKKKDDIREIGRSMRQHGHYGVEIYLITHRPSDLNKDVLCSVVNHFVLRRKFGMDSAIVWEFGEAMTTWGKSVADSALNKKVWKYPKHLYKFYVSSENHQVKKTFPIKYALFALLPLFMFAYVAKHIYEKFYSKNDEVSQVTNIEDHPNFIPKNSLYQAEPVIPVQAEPETYQSDNQTDRKDLNIQYNITDPYSTDYSAVNYDYKQAPQLAGCAILNNQCSCYTQQMTIIKISQSDCKRYMAGDKPFNPLYQQQQQNDRLSMPEFQTISELQ